MRTLEKSTTLLLHPFNGVFSRTTWVSLYKKGKLKVKGKAPHDSVFYRPDALPAAQPTASEH